MRHCPPNSGDILSALARVEGLDAGAGLFHAGGNGEAYAGILRRFCGEYERHEAAIRQYLCDMDWKAYSVKLHAMKGLFATIGAGALSAKAYRLELASKNGDTDVCRRETPEFCEAMRVFRESLCGTSVVPPRKSGPRTPVAPAVIAEKLAELKRACLEGDSDVADAVSACLSTLSLDGKTNESLDAICALAELLDYDEVVKQIDALLPGLNGV